MTIQRAVRAALANGSGRRPDKYSVGCKKRTPIKPICHNPQVRNPCRTRKWCLSRCVRQQRRNNHAVGRPDLLVFSRDDLCKFVLARTLATSSRSDSTDRYAAVCFIHTAGFVPDSMFDHPRSRSVRLVAALRKNSLWTARSVLRIPGLHVNHPFAADRCILCNNGIDNVHPLAHLVIVCVSVRAARRQAGLNPLIDRAREQDPKAKDDTILTRLLGEASQGEAAAGHTWIGGTVEYVQEGTEGRPAAARLAGFLSVAHPRCQVRLWHFHRERQLEAAQHD
ncbi:hypothetical protein HK105_204743 [Polyrhizophydium stewartii]|uniref:Uncharacterized protein n=1 Tax=Polyrhizophydium stewartii TaxID=2732419 RepID=A0ABR4N8J9_9FUNG